MGFARSDGCNGCMSRRWWVLAALVVAAAIALYLFQPWRLVTRSTVDEALPVAGSVATQTMSTTEAGATSESALTGTATTAAPRPTEPQTLAQGRFVDAEHATSGTARIIRLADGSRYVRLEDLSSSDGPDLHVWLTDQPSGGEWGSYDDGRYVALGALKGTDGNQNYAIPAEVELDGLISVVIWCDRFDVAFGTAALDAA